MEVQKVENLGMKKHIVSFTTDKGSFTVETNDLEELASVSWFRKFMGVEDASVSLSVSGPKVSDSVSDYREVQREIAKVNFVPDKKIVKDYMMITPSQMNDADWGEMSVEQRNAWVHKYNS